MSYTRKETFDYIDIKLLKFVLGWYDDIDCYLKEMDEKFDFSNCPDAYHDYLNRVFKYIVEGKMDIKFNKQQEEFIENYKPLFEALDNYFGKVNWNPCDDLRRHVWLLSSIEIRNFVNTISNHPQCADYIYEAFEKLEERGVEEVKFDINPIIKWGITDSDHILVDYLDSLQIGDGDFIYNYIATPDTKYNVQISIKNNKLTYSSRIEIGDILNFNVDKIPSTVEEVGKFVDMIDKKSKLYKDKKEIKELEKISNDYSNSFDKLNKIVCSRGIYNNSELYNMRSEKKAFKNRVDEYINTEMQRIMDDDKQIDTQGVKVRI